MTESPTSMQAFLRMSAELTGFSEYRLTGTGMARDYLDAVTSVVGDEVVRALLQTYDDLPDSNDEERRRADLRTQVLADERLGPVARNVVKLWYVGTWYELPATWRERFGVRDLDATFVVSPVAYTEGLLWPAAGANPPGAKGPGYATWAKPPRLPADEE